jgi:predicted transglutaminase-like cysteine proteinase
MNTRSKKTYLTFLFFMSVSFGANSFPLRAIDEGQGGVLYMNEGQVELAPMPYVMFCISYPDECRFDKENAGVVLSQEKLAELRSVNRHVNSAIRPKADHSIRRMWHLGVSSGDCNAYAVEKRHRLIESGWPVDSLLLTVAKTSWGEGHLVVTVHTDRGDFILDSLTDQVRPWHETSYTWVMRQSSNDPKDWVALNNEGVLTAKRKVQAEDVVARLDGQGRDPSIERLEQRWEGLRGASLANRTGSDAAAVERPLDDDMIAGFDETITGHVGKRTTKSWVPARGVSMSAYDIGLSD